MTPLSEMMNERRGTCQDVTRKVQQTASGRANLPPKLSQIGAPKCIETDLKKSQF